MCLFVGSPFLFTNCSYAICVFFCLNLTHLLQRLYFSKQSVFCCCCCYFEKFFATNTKKVSTLKLRDISNSPQLVNRRIRRAFNKNESRCIVVVAVTLVEIRAIYDEGCAESIEMATIFRIVDIVLEEHLKVGKNKRKNMKSVI